MAAAALERFGRIDAVFANAGFGATRGFLEESLEHWRSMVLTNVYGVGADDPRHPPPPARARRRPLPRSPARSPAGGRCRARSTRRPSGRRRRSARRCGPELRQMHENHDDPGDPDRAGDDRHRRSSTTVPASGRCSDDDIAHAVIYALEQPPGRRRQRDPDPARPSPADLTPREQEAHQAPVGAQGEARRQERASGGMKGESRSGVSQEANSAALTVRVRLDLAALAQEARQPARGLRSSRRASAAPSRRRSRPAIRASSVASRAGASRTSSARRVDADQEGPAVALEPAPLVLAGAELVVVVDDRRRLDPERAAAQPQPQREVDVLVVEEEALGEAADLLPGRAAGSPGRRRRAPATSPGRRRLGDRAAVPAGPDDPGEVDGVAGGVDPSSPPPSATSACQAAQPRLLQPGAADRLAAAGQRRRVGVEDDQQVARSPRRRRRCRRRRSRRCAAGADDRAPRAPARATTSAVPSPESLSTTISSSPSPSSGSSAGRVLRQLLAAVPSDDQDRERRAHRRGG